MKEENCMKDRHKTGRRGPSSYYVHDSEKVFEMLDLSGGECLVDIGCGRGDYSLRALELLGESGEVISIDKEKVFLEGLLDFKREYPTDNLTILRADIRDGIPVEDCKADICLISTMFHCIDMKEYGGGIASEVRRILKPSGKLAVIECKKENTFRGPPLELRLSPDDIEAVFTPYGFERKSLTFLGDNYLLILRQKVIL